MGVRITKRTGVSPYAFHVSRAATRGLGRQLAQIILLLSWLVHGAAFAAPEILVVLSEDSTPYREVVDAIRQRLQRSVPPRISLATLSWRSFAAPTGQETRLIVAIGAKAAQTAAQARTSLPIVCALLPKRAFEIIQRRAMESGWSGPLTAIYLDQPVSRQFDLLQLVLPGRNRVGLIVGPEADSLLSEVSGVARARKLSVNIEHIDSGQDLPRALEKVLDQSDAMLMLPDPMVSNANSVHNLLLTSYRYQRPVIGFSPGYVRAGALAAVYSTPSQIGEQLGDLLVDVLVGRAALPAPAYPMRFEVSINYHVARSFGLRLEDETSIVRKLRQQGDAS